MISRILIGILIISLSSCVGVTVTEARNEYLNNGTNTLFNELQANDLESVKFI